MQALARRIRSFRVFPRSVAPDNRIYANVFDPHPEITMPSAGVFAATGYFSQARDAETLGKLLFKPVRASEIRSALDDMLQRAH